MKKNLFIILLFTFLAGSCGFKSPPLVPDVKPPLALKDIRYKIFDNKVKIEWEMPDDNSLNKSGLSGFLIYRSKKESDLDCNNCPVIFSIIGKPVTKNYYIERLEPGYKYVFKVIVKTNNNMTSPGSNFIEFNY